MPITASSVASTALGLSVALAWNETIKHFINGQFRPTGDEQTLSKTAASRAMLAYALTVTVIILLVVLIAGHVSRLTSRVAAKFSTGRRASERPPNIWAAKSNE